MKKSKLLFERLPFSKRGFLPVVLTFLFIAILQVDMKAQASSFTGSGAIQPPERAMFQTPTGPFVSVAIAKDRLLAAITGLKHQLSILAEGTAQYDAAYRRYVYYNEIYNNLNHGASVADAIVKSLSILTTATSSPFLATPEEAIVEKNAAIALLKL